MLLSNQNPRIWYPSPLPSSSLTIFPILPSSSLTIFPILPSSYLPSSSLTIFPILPSSSLHIFSSSFLHPPSISFPHPSLLSFLSPFPYPSSFLYHSFSHHLRNLYLFLLHLLFLLILKYPF